MTTRKQLQSIEKSFSELTKPLHEIVKHIKQLKKHFIPKELSQNTRELLVNSNAEEDYYAIFQILNHNLNQANLKIQDGLNSMTKQLVPVFDQLKFMLLTITEEEKYQEKLQVCRVESVQTKYSNELNKLALYINEHLFDQVKRIKEKVSLQFKNKKKLTFCRQEFDIEIPQFSNHRPNPFQNYDYTNNIMVKKDGVKQNLFKSYLLDNQSLQEQQPKSEALLSGATDKSKSDFKKLIQSDPQSNIFNSNQVPKQNNRDHLSAESIFSTPLPKNKKIQMIGQPKSQNQSQNIHQQNHKQPNNLKPNNNNNLKEQRTQQCDNRKVENNNQGVQYSGSFSDRVASDNILQVQKFFKKNPPTQLNITDKSNSRKSNQREEPPIFQSPNFNALNTKGEINRALNNYQENQSQLTILSRQTRDIRDMSKTGSNINFDLQHSLKTRAQDPIINGSQNDDFTNELDCDYEDAVSKSDLEIFTKMERLFTQK